MSFFRVSIVKFFEVCGQIIQNNPLEPKSCLNSTDKVTNCKQQCTLGSNENRDFFQLLKQFHKLKQMIIE